MDHYNQRLHPSNASAQPSHRFTLACQALVTTAGGRAGVQWRVITADPVMHDVIRIAIHKMVDVAISFFRQEENRRSSSKVREAVAVASFTLASASAVFTLGVPETFGAFVLTSAFAGLSIACSCVAAAQIWLLVAGGSHVVHITDMGIEWDDYTFDWNAVRKIRWLEGRRQKLGLLSITVSRPGLHSNLSLPIRMSNPVATALRAELRAFLSSAGYNVCWIN